MKNVFKSFILMFSLSILSLAKCYAINMSVTITNDIDKDISVTVSTLNFEGGRYVETWRTKEKSELIVAKSTKVIILENVNPYDEKTMKISFEGHSSDIYAGNTYLISELIQKTHRQKEYNRYIELLERKKEEYNKRCFCRTGSHQLHLTETKTKSSEKLDVTEYILLSSFKQFEFECRTLAREFYVKFGNRNYIPIFCSYNSFWIDEVFRSTI